ncbi:MAG: hypothetical protein E6J13_12505 [Chloroflexi bacterium]|nr:MAG: hypothetical protein E6J13_12505 [Chloroflexota bacterium]
MNRSAELREGDIRIPRAATRHADDGANDEHTDVSENGPPERARPQVPALRAKSMDHDGGGGQDHQEIGEAEPEGDRRVGVDVLEEPRLCGDRNDAALDRELLEEDRRTEQDVETESGVYEGPEHDDGADERDDEQSVAATSDDGDRVGRRKGERQRGESQGHRRRPRCPRRMHPRGGE